MIEEGSAFPGRLREKIVFSSKSQSLRLQCPLEPTCKGRVDLADVDEQAELEWEGRSSANEGKRERRVATRDRSPLVDVGRRGRAVIMTDYRRAEVMLTEIHGLATC